MRFRLDAAMAYQYSRRIGRRRARFPNDIRRHRVRAEFSQRDLARRIGTTRSVLAAWERGHRIPKLWYLFRMARIFHVFVETLYFSL